MKLRFSLLTKLHLSQRFRTPPKTAVRIRGIARKRAAEARKMAVAASSKRIPTATPSQQVTRTESKILTEFTSVKQVNSLDTEHERKQLNNKDFEAEIALKNDTGNGS